MKVVQITVHTGPVGLTRSGCIFPEGCVVVKPGLAGELASGLQNQELVLGHVLPSRWVRATKDPHIHSEGFHPSYDVCNLTYPLLGRHEQVSIQVRLGLGILGLDVFGQQVRQIDELPGLYFCNQLLRDGRISWADDKRLMQQRSDRVSQGGCRRCWRKKLAGGGKRAARGTEGAKQRWM